MQNSAPDEGRYVALLVRWPLKISKLTRRQLDDPRQQRRALSSDATRQRGGV